MDHAPLPVMASNEDGYYVYQNAAAQQFLGYEPAEIIGKHLADVLAYDRQLITMTLERLKQRGHLSGRARYRHAEGSLREADVNFFGQALTDGTRVFVSLAHPLPAVSAALPGLLESGTNYGLTDAEMRLLQLIADGFSDEPIAILLGVTQEAVAQQVQGVMAKMMAASRTEAAVLALKNRVLL
jgi:PAS domain S-box-containing protein